MLILTRRIGETLVTGDGEDKAEITILGIKGNQVRIGVSAEKHVPVHRLEVYNRIQEQKDKEETENE